jgi:hypothetical protein
VTSPAVVATPGALSLGALLLRATRLTPEQLDDARARAEDAGTSLVDVLIENGMLEEQEILGALGEALGMPVRSPIAADRIDAELVDKIPIAFAKSRHPAARTHHRRHRAHRRRRPFDTDAIDDLRCSFDAPRSTGTREPPRDPRRHQPRLRSRPGLLRSARTDASEISTRSPPRSARTNRRISSKPPTTRRSSAW